MSVINILMQLRKVCNHPNLFDPRPIQSPFITQPIVFNTASLVQDALEVSPMKVSMKGKKRRSLNSVRNFNLKERFFFSYIHDLIPVENCTLSKQKKLFIYFFVCPQRCDLSMFDLIGLESRVSRYQADVFLPRHKVNRQLIQEIVESPEPPPRPKPVRMKVNR